MKLTLGRLIYIERRRRELSQKDAAALLGVSAQYLNDIEQDKRQPTKPETLQTIADTFQVPLDVVYFTVGKLPPDIVPDEYTADQILRAFGAMRRVLNNQEAIR